jgi:hypothetical protein
MDENHWLLGAFVVVATLLMVSATIMFFSGGLV